MQNRVIFPPPEKHVLFDFIVQSNLIAQVDLGPSDVQQTFERKFMNPAAHGHFAGIQTITELAMKTYMPVKHSIQFESVSQSEKNLDWLRTLHERVMSPIAQYGEFVPGIQHLVSHGDCGNYRIKANWIGAGRPTPKPSSIPDLMHWWHKELGAFHLKWLPKLNKAGSLTIQDANTLANEAYQKHIQLVCIHPWKEGNGRVGRLVENLLRMRWGLAWKTIKHKDRMTYITDIMEYEDSQPWQSILKQNNAK